MISIPDKYKVLGIFILFTMNNGFAWLMFDPVAGWLETNVKGLGRSQLELLSSWQPAVFLCMCIPIMKIVTRYDGLRFAVRLGATAEIAGALLKLIGSASRKSYAGLVFLNLGQILSGVGSPVATGTVSALSALWFEPEERTRATAAAVLFNSVGNAVCYLLVPIMTEHLTFTSVTVYELIMAAIAVTLAWMFFPQERLPEASVEEAETEGNAKQEHTDVAQDGQEVVAHAKDHAGLRTQLAALLSIPSCVCLLCVYAWLSGGFSAWISLFAATYNKFYGEGFIGIMSAFGMLAYVGGGLVSSYFVDMYFSRQMKYVIFFCIVMNTLSNLIFVASTPNDKGYCLWNLGKGFMVFSTAMCGFWNGAAAPLFYELVAEISFPVEEGVSGICISVMENVGALVFYQVVSRFFRGQSMSVAYSFGMTVAVALCAAVKQRYNRSYHTYLMESGQAN